MRARAWARAPGFRTGAWSESRWRSTRARPPRAAIRPAPPRSGRERPSAPVRSWWRARGSANGRVVADQAHVRERTEIGDESVVGRGASVENDVRVGSRVRMQTGSYVTAWSVVEDDVFIAPCAIFTNDPTAGRRSAGMELRGPVLRRGCRIGAGAVLLPGVEIGADAFVGAGAVVTRDVPPGALVVGRPGARGVRVRRRRRSLAPGRGTAALGAARHGRVRRGRARRAQTRLEARHGAGARRDRSPAPRGRGGGGGDRACGARRLPRGLDARELHLQPPDVVRVDVHPGALGDLCAPRAADGGPVPERADRAPAHPSLRPWNRDRLRCRHRGAPEPRRAARARPRRAVRGRDGPDARRVGPAAWTSRTSTGAARVS